MRVRDVAEYRDFMVRSLDDRDEIEEYEKNGAQVFRCRGAIHAPGEVDVDGRILGSSRIVIATGSRPAVPAIDGLEQCGYWTNREVTGLEDVPDSAIVLGGGPVGIELAQILHGFAARVTLVEAADRLLAREDPAVGELILEALREAGIEVVLGSEVSAVKTGREGKVATLQNGHELSASELVVAIGREPRVEEIGLEHVGIEPCKHGIEVDERCRRARASGRSGT